MVNYQLLQLHKNMESVIEQIVDEIKIIKGYFESEWVPISEVASTHGISRQALQKKINNGLIDPSRDARWEGNRLMVRRNAIPKLKRIRANKNVA